MFCHHRWRIGFSLVATLFLILPIGSLAVAQTTRIWNTGSGNWATSNNWTPSGVPGAGDSVVVTSSSQLTFTVTYDYAGAAVSLNKLTVEQGGSTSIGHSAAISMAAHVLMANTESIGDSSGGGSNGVGILTQSGGSNNVSLLFLGFNASDQGTYNLSGSGILNAAGSMEIIGNTGRGTFSETAGSNTASTIKLGNFSGSNGGYTLSGGTLSVTANEFVGLSGTGAVQQSGGTSTIGATLSVGDGNSASGSGANGDYSLSGTGTLSAHDEIIGNFGAGTFEQAASTNTVTATLSVGSVATGAYSLSGGSLKANQELVGDHGTGSVTHSAGSNILTGGNLILGNSAGGVGTYNLSGTGAITGNQFVGLDGTGVFNQTGGTYNTDGGLFSMLSVGLHATGNGMYTLSGGSLQSLNENIGDSGTGSFSQSGGTNSVSQLSISDNSGSSGVYALSGNGQLTATGGEIVGANGPGSFTQNGGTNTGPSLRIGANSGSSGAYTLSNGALSVASEVVGESGMGVFNQTGGTHAVTSFMDVGENSNSSGTFTLSGGALSSVEESIGGGGGTGTFNQSAGTNTITGGGDVFRVSFNSASSGTYNLSGSGVLDVVNGNEDVGGFGTGNFNQTGGMNVVGSSLIVANGSSSNGIYTLSNGTVSVRNLQIADGGNSNGAFTLTGGSLSVSSDESVGDSSTGTFNQTGGTHHIGGNLSLGSFLGGNGVFTLGGISASVGTGVYVGGSASGAAGVGTLTVNSGGMLTIAGTLTAYNGFGNAINLSGGAIAVAGLNFNGVPSLFHWTTGTLNITSPVTWDFGVSPTTTSAAFGSSLALGNNQTLNISTGDETLGGIGAFGLTLNSGSTHNVIGALIVATNGTLTQNSGSTLIASSVSQQGGTINGTLMNQGNFEYRGGVFNGRLVNLGTFSINGVGSGANSFTAGNGVENDAAMEVDLGQTVVANGQGFDNLGMFTLKGGTLSGNAPALNDLGGTLQAHGTINSTLTNSGVLTIDGVLRLNGSGNTNNGTVQGAGALFGSFANAAGGTVYLASGRALVINNAWSNAGLVTLAGNGAVLAGGILTNTGTIQGAGSVGATITNTGVVRASGGELDLTAAGNTNGATGSIQAATGNSILMLPGLTTNAGTIALTGGAFDNNNHSLANSGIINGYGTLRTGGLTNTGKLNVGEGNLDVFGNITNNGTIGIQGGRSVYFFGNENGAGSFTGVGAAVFLAAVSPGNSPASVSFGGDADLTSTSTLNIELGGTMPGIQYDQLLVTGQLALGGTLVVSLINGFAPALNQSFDLLDWGSLAGNFASLSLPTLGGGLSWNTAQLYTTGTLSVVSVGISGDYDNNGVVDAADFVVWRKNQGTTNVLANDPIGGTIGTAQYDQWRSHFGQPSGSGAGATMNATIPEPSTLVLLMFTGAGWCLRQGRAA
jgi:fibronectin-binding autotransporter adhesin